MRTCVDMSTVITVAVMVSSPLLRSALLRAVCIWDRRCASVSSRFHGERLFLFLGSLGAHEACMYVYMVPCMCLEFLRLMVYTTSYLLAGEALEGRLKMPYIVSVGGRST